MNSPNDLDLQETIEWLRSRLSKVLPDAEIRLKAELAYEINLLKREKNAVILGHNYMEAALYHSVPDYVGDSLELSRVAAETDADIIIFCGVEFMAETAKILNPEKTVLLPAHEAGCSLAASITAEDVRSLKEMYPGIPVITYVNTYAEVKAECDACCTSANAADVVRSFDTDKIIFLPDEFLAQNVAQETGKEIIIAGRGRPAESGPFNIIGWEGRCEVHDRFTVADIENARKQFPDVLVVSHPECSPEVVAASDFSSSTTKMIEYVKTTDAPQYLILTECAMGDNIIAENPEKEVLRLCSVRCPHMNQITLEGVLHSLNTLEKEISLPEEVIRQARRSVDYMLSV